MTGYDLKWARTFSKTSRDELGERLGVSGQTIGAWERMQTEDILQPRKRESEATAKARGKLVPQYRYMHAMATFQLSFEGLGNQLIIPAPHPWPFYINEGEPLILIQTKADPGDLVVLMDDDRHPSTIGRVMEEKLNGRLLVRLLHGLVQPLPDPGEYLVVEYYIHKAHKENPDWPVGALDNFPGDMT